MVLAQPQNDLIVTGKIGEEVTGEPLEGVNVFLANTTIGATSGKDGHFIITNIPYGSYDIIFSRLGYETAKKSFRSYKPGVFEFNISLKPKELSLKEVTINGTIPEDWRENLDNFTKVFIGETENSGKTRILNPEVLNFEKDPNTGALKAYSDSVIKVENDALGYMLYISLDSLVYDVQNEYIMYKFYPKFVELPPSDEKERLKWEENRRETYLVSSRHFFYSLVHKQLDADYYSLSKSSSVNEILLGFGIRISPHDLNLTTDADSAIFTLDLMGALEIKSYHGSPSFLDFLLPSLSIDKYGNVMEFDYAVRTSGYWAKLRVADLLPQNYVYTPK